MDVGRIGAAVGQPGIDGRVWTCAARVSTDDDAIRFDPELGRLVDVEIVGGPLDGEGPIVARVAEGFAEDGGILSHPIAAGDFVALELGHDPNDLPVIVGHVFADGTKPPTTVNEDEVDADLLAAAHVLRSSKRAEVELGGRLRVRTPELVAIADAVKLADENAAQPFVRGTSYADALDAFLDAIQQATLALVPTGAPPATPITVAQTSAYLTAVTAAVQVFKAARPGYLSTRIAGE